MKVNKIFILFLTSMLLFACSEKDPITYNGPTESSFVTESDVNLYATEGNNIFVEVGVTTVSDKDRVVSVEVVYNDDDEQVKAGTQAQENVHYTINKTVTIPANSVIGKVEITPNFESLGATVWNIDLKVVDSDDVSAAGYRNTVTFNMVKFIPYNADDIPGQYIAVNELYGDDVSYPVTITKTEVENVFEVAGEIPGGATYKIKLVGGDSPDSEFYCEVVEVPDAVWFQYPYKGALYNAYMDMKGKRGYFSTIGPKIVVIVNGDIPGLGWFSDLHIVHTKVQ